MLYTSPSHPTYGSGAQGASVPAPEIDPENLRRQREALEQICAETSNELIDVMHHNVFTSGNKFTDGYGELFSRAFGGTADSNDQDEEEAWINVVRNAEGLDEVKGLTKGDLVVQLAEPPAVPAPAKRVGK